MKPAPLAALALRVAVGAIFMYSGWTKLMEPSSNFAGVILGYRIVDLRTAIFISTALPWFEWAAGAFLALGLWTRQSLAALGGLCLVFFGAIVSTYIRKIPLQDCGCFGQGPHTMPLWGTLILDAVLITVISCLFWKKEASSRYGLDRLLKT